MGEWSSRISHGPFDGRLGGLKPLPRGAAAGRIGANVGAGIKPLTTQDEVRVDCLSTRPLSGEVGAILAEGRGHGVGVGAFVAAETELVCGGALVAKVVGTGALGLCACVVERACIALAVFTEA